MRRYLAIALDCYLCLLAAGLLTRPYVHAAETGRAVILTALPALALSFVNQVLLTAAVRASAGKLIMGVRVVGLPDARRPGLGQLIRRWLYGLVRLPLQPWYRLRKRPARPGARRPACGQPGIPQPGVPQPEGSRPGSMADDDVAGLRQVRRGDLRTYRRSVAAHASA
ncbi:RDD family protein [Streptomyces sp. NBC_00887]|uniref:RDD family protein n=1 Tax=Streptomyces sp. NBC_00887 TaxID=2975859 RepID=UPI003865EE71|nr:RDD family protein [Streptomyces sp. NBC_00887]